MGGKSPCYACVERRCALALAHDTLERAIERNKDFVRNKMYFHDDAEVCIFWNFRYFCRLFTIFFFKQSSWVILCRDIFKISFVHMFLYKVIYIYIYIRWNSYHNVFLDIVQNFVWNDVDEALKFAFVPKNWLLNKEQLLSLQWI